MLVQVQVLSPAIVTTNGSLPSTSPTRILASHHLRFSTNRLRRDCNGAGVPSAGWFATREVTNLRAIELPGVQLLDRRVGIGERSLRDAQEIQCPVQAPSLRRAADVNVALVGQRDGTVHALCRPIF